MGDKVNGVLPWMNPKGVTCEHYAEYGWCYNGKIVPAFAWTTGKHWNYPENNCCACAKSSDENPEQKVNIWKDSDPLMDECVDLPLEKSKGVYDIWTNGVFPAGHEQECDCHCYLQMGWCSGSKVNAHAKWTKGSKLNNPEKHCCVCGGGDKPRK